MMRPLTDKEKKIATSHADLDHLTGAQIKRLLQDDHTLCKMMVVLEATAKDARRAYESEDPYDYRWMLMAVNRLIATLSGEMDND